MLAMITPLATGLFLEDYFFPQEIGQRDAGAPVDGVKDRNKLLLVVDTHEYSLHSK